MFLPTGEHHILLMHDRRDSHIEPAELECSYARIGLAVAGALPELWQKLRRVCGNAVIRLGRWVRGPQHPTFRRVISQH